jgi:hypothetical protein
MHWREAARVVWRPQQSQPPISAVDASSVCRVSEGRAVPLKRNEMLTNQPRI